MEMSPMFCLSTQQPSAGNWAGPWEPKELLHKLKGLIRRRQVSIGKWPAEEGCSGYPPPRAPSQGPHLITRTSALICKILDKTKSSPLLTLGRVRPQCNQSTWSDPTPPPQPPALVYEAVSPSGDPKQTSRVEIGVPSEGSAGAFASQETCGKDWGGVMVGTEHAAEGLACSNHSAPRSTAPGPQILHAAAKAALSLPVLSRRGQALA